MRKKGSELYNAQEIIDAYYKEGSVSGAEKVTGIERETITRYLRKYHIVRTKIYYSPERCRFMSKIASQQRHTEEFKRKMSERMRGKNHPMWKGGKIKYNCIICNKKTMKAPAAIKDHYYITCSPKCRIELVKIIHSDEKHYNWRGGISGDPYPFNFSKKLFKNKIRERDDNICQLCGKTEKENGRVLDIHHINYEKKDLEFFNLISLCRKCHSKTNHNRDYWFAEIMDLQAFNYIGNIA